MRYFITERVAVDGPEFSESSFEQIGAWVYLMSYCAAQENGGRIEGAKGRKDAFFDRSLKVSRTILEQESQLWTWTEDYLLVHFYSLEAEQSYQNKRESGQRGGKKRAENLARAKARATADALATKPNPTQSHETKEDQTQPNSSEELAAEEIVSQATRDCVYGNGSGSERSGNRTGQVLHKILKWIETVKKDGKIFLGPDKRLTLQAQAREFVSEMEQVHWSIEGDPIESPIGLFRHRMAKKGLLRRPKQN